MKRSLKTFIGLSILAASLFSINYASAETLSLSKKKILDQTSKNQVAMFSDQHGGYRKDSDFVIGLLQHLKKQGFQYFAIEIKRDPPKLEIPKRFKDTPLNPRFRNCDRTDSSDEKVKSLLETLTIKEAIWIRNTNNRLLRDYALNKIKREDISYSWQEFISSSVNGWFDLIDSARKSGMEIICYDIDSRRIKDKNNTFNIRDKIAFKNLKEQTFDKDPHAKVVVYCGALHLNEEPFYDSRVGSIETSSDTSKPKYKSLGYHLSRFTKGKTLTVDLRGKFRGKKIPYCDLVVDLDE